MADKGHPPLATSYYPLAPESRRLSRPDQTYHQPLTHAQWVVTWISQGTRAFPLEPPHGLHSHSCGLQCPLGRQLPKAGRAGRLPAGAVYLFTSAFTYYYDPVILRNKLTPLSIFKDLALRKRDSKSSCFTFMCFIGCIQTFKNDMGW